jgi:hypothetical protein
MEKFTTIVGICILATGIAGAVPAAAACLQQADFVARQVRGEPDWLRRETVLAMLIEARRDAARGHESACIATLNRARAQLREPRG